MSLIGTKKLVAVGWLAKGVTILGTFANVRLLVELTGVEGFAAHAIVFSMLTWLTLLNLGLPTAIQNAMAGARAKGSPSGSLKCDAVGAVFALALAVQPVLLLLAVVARPILFGTFGFVELPGLWFAVVAMTMSALGLTFNQMLYAEDRAVWPNIYPAFVSIGSMVGLLALRQQIPISFDAVLAAFFVPYVLAFFVGLMLVRPWGNWQLNLEATLRLVRSARGFAIFATLLAITSAADYILLANLAVPRDIGEYAIANRLFIGVLSLFAVILANQWSTWAELMRRGTYAAIRNRVGATLKAGLALGVASGLALWGMIDYLAALLSSGKIETVPAGIMAGWLTYLIVRIWTDTFATLLLASGHPGIVNRALLIQASVGIPLQFVCVTRFGAAGAVAGMTLGLVLTSGWLLPKHAFRLLAKRSE